MSDITIPANSTDSAKLILREAAQAINGCADLIAKLPDAQDPTFVPNITVSYPLRDHVKKLAWVYALLEGKTSEDMLKEQRGEHIVSNDPNTQQP